MDEYPEIRFGHRQVTKSTVNRKGSHLEETGPGSPPGAYGSH